MSKEILEDALNSYEGTVLYVSHDRYFINKTAHRILDLTGGRLINYIGNYDYYLEKKETVMAALFPDSPAPSDAPKVSEAKLDWKAKKEEQARIRKKENDLKKCENQISSLEKQLEELQAQMSDPSIGTQAAKLMELAKEQEKINIQLEELYEKWEALAD